MTTTTNSPAVPVDASYGSIDGLELVSAGMDWPAETGPLTVTREHIAAMIAAQADPHVQAPRVRLGHFSDVNAGVAQWDPFAAIGDAEPAFGHFENLRTTNDGATLVGDAVDVPMWLVQSAPSAFPNRSAETVANVITPGGKRYAAVLTGVALLGARLPAVSDLEDLRRLIVEGPDTTFQTAATSAAQHEEAPMPAATALSVSTDVVRKKFNSEWTAEDHGLGLDTTWWWVRDIRVDPDEVIVDDDAGNLWSVPFTTDGADGVTFGQPVRVKQDFVPVPVMAAAARVAGSGRTIATFSRPAVGEKTAAAAAVNATDLGGMATAEKVVLGALAAVHGLDPEKATEQDVATAVVADPPKTDAPKATPAKGPAVAQNDPVSAAASAALSAATARVAELERRDADRESAAVSARLDALADSWVREGRIPPSERGNYRGLLDVDEARTTALAGALSKDRVPVLQRTANTVTYGATSDDDALLSATLNRLGVTSRQEA